MISLTIVSPDTYRRMVTWTQSGGPLEENPKESKEREVQGWLFPAKNPLEERLGKGFFESIPKCPGVYTMIGVQNSILYIGKAKNLRARLYSYKRAKTGQVSRKIIRMVHLIKEIRLETCESESAALIRENELLRTHKPPFNVVNTHPESYYFIGIRRVGAEIRFRLTTQSKRQGDLLFGAFKSRRLVREGYASLLRLIWAAQNTEDRFDYPYRLSRRQPAYLYSIRFQLEWEALLKKFFNGSSDALILILTEALLRQENIPPFFYHWIQEDIQTVQAFFQFCTSRNRNLKLAQKVKGRLIPQNQLDDLLVLERFRLKAK